MGTITYWVRIITFRVPTLTYWVRPSTAAEALVLTITFWVPHLGQAEAEGSLPVWRYSLAAWRGRQREGRRRGQAANYNLLGASSQETPSDFNEVGFGNRVRTFRLPEPPAQL